MDLPTQPWDTRIGTTFFLETGGPISRAYRNGNFGDYGRSSILKQTAGSYARGATWLELNLQIQQKIPIRTGELWAQFMIDNVTNQRQGYGAISFDNRWVSYAKQFPINLTLAMRYDY